jgi:hypothetical protein
VGGIALKTEFSRPHSIYFHRAELSHNRADINEVYLNPKDNAVSRRSVGGRHPVWYWVSFKFFGAGRPGGWHEIFQIDACGRKR